MSEKPDPHIDWSLTTWKGSRLDQHRRFYALPFSRKLELIEQMAEFARQLGAAQKTVQSSPGAREDPAAYQSHTPPDGDPAK